MLSFASWIMSSARLEPLAYLPRTALTPRMDRVGLIRCAAAASAGYCESTWPLQMTLW